MDRADIQARLDRAEQIAADGERLIERQRRRVIDIEHGGRDSSHARAMLRTLLGGRAVQAHGRQLLRGHLSD